MQSRKFLFYMYALAGGGAERVFALLASEFARQGHDVTFAVDFETKENAAFLDPAVKCVTLPSGHLGSLLGLRRLIRALKPDVSLSGIGASNLKHMFAALLSGRARRALISFHGFFPSEPERLSRIGNGLTPLLTRLCGRAVAVSDGLRDTLVARHGADPRRTLRIHNPVATLGAPARLSAAELAARPPVVLYVGRFSPDKDLPCLLRAFACVRHPEARFEIVGNGPGRQEMEDLAGRLDLGGRISFRGYLPDPAEAYRGARCFAIASKLETFGNVVAEALAHGLPVAATASAGPSEILDGGLYGALVPVGDHAALAAAIDAALTAPGEPEPRMARAAEFSPERIAGAYLAACEAIVAEAE